MQRNRIKEIAWKIFLRKEGLETSAAERSISIRITMAELNLRLIYLQQRLVEARLEFLRSPLDQRKLDLLSTLSQSMVSLVKEFDRCLYQTPVKSFSKQIQAKLKQESSQSYPKIGNY